MRERAAVDNSDKTRWHQSPIQRIVIATASKHFHVICGKICGQRAIKHTNF
jgi:PIN domain nuclease of toxin-antitoxin system